MVFQDYVLIERISVIDNLKMIDSSLREEEIDKVLKDLKIDQLKERKVSHLSGGEKQRVSIARAILKKPKFIVCDEPTGNLDSKNSIIVMEILKVLSKDYLIILVSHNLELVKEYSDRIIYMEDGTIVNDEILNQVSYQEKEIKKETVDSRKINLLDTLFTFKKKTNFIFTFLLMFICVLNFTFCSLITNNTSKLNHIIDNYIRLETTLNENQYYLLSEKFVFTNNYLPSNVSVFTPKHQTFLSQSNHYQIQESFYPHLIRTYDDQDYNLISGRKIENKNECVISNKLATYVINNAESNTLKLEKINVTKMEQLIGFKMGNFVIVGINDLSDYSFTINYDDIVENYLIYSSLDKYHSLSFYNKHYALENHKLEKKIT